MTTSGPVATGLIPVITTWIWRVATLTGTWWLQTLAGGVVLGIGPATLVLHRRLRSAVQGTEEGTLREAWRSWRENFRDAQLRITLPILTVIVLGFYAVALRGTPLAITVAVLGAVYLIWLMHLPAVAAATDLERAAPTPDTASSSGPGSPELQPIATSASKRRNQNADDDDLSQTLSRAMSTEIETEEERRAREPLSHTRTGTSVGSTASRPPGFEVIFEENDPENPKNWPFWYRCYCLVTVSYCTWLVVLYSTSFTSATPGLIEVSFRHLIEA